MKYIVGIDVGTSGVKCHNTRLSRTIHDFLSFFHGNEEGIAIEFG